MKVICENCGKENPENRKFCSECGKRIKKKTSMGRGIEAPYPGKCGMKPVNYTASGALSDPCSYRSGLTASEFIFILLFSPPAGLIGFLVWYGKKPKRARQSLTIALVMFLFFMIIFLF